LGRYADLPLGFSDACVVACAEGHGGKLLSLDKHFAVVAREGTLRLLPEAY
jgi:predicted nucleic acid-binding protein